MKKQIFTFGQRKLQVEEAGDLAGFPVIFHGGTPGSSVLLEDWVDDAKVNGIRLIGYARPGYGESTRMAGRRVADAAADVALIAQQLDLKRFATIGASGGGPHAIATAALLPDRVTAAVAMASPAPYGVPGLDWFEGMDEGGKAEFHAALAGQDAITTFASGAAPDFVNASPEEMAAGFRAMARTEADQPLMERIGLWFSAASRDGLKNGVAGWVDDDLAFCKGWGIDLTQISVPVLVLQGSQDVLVPATHGHWLGQNIASAQLQIFDQDDHGTLFGKRFALARSWLEGFK